MATDHISTNILSPQQMAIMQYLVDGYSIKDISQKMGIQNGTIKKYLLRVRAKTKTQSMYQCIAALVAQGVVMPTQIGDG
jgi:DNA-binding NarL/FixJ family response regulator